MNREKVISIILNICPYAMFIFGEPQEIESSKEVGWQEHVVVLVGDTQLINLTPLHIPVDNYF